jgi:hypothetical protein
MYVRTFTHLLALGRQVAESMCREGAATCSTVTQEGWRMPPNTVKVDRSTRWGNPFRPTASMPVEKTIEKFGVWIEKDREGQQLRTRGGGQLVGKNLAVLVSSRRSLPRRYLLRIANR